jgi:hypothetical protein
MRGVAALPFQILLVDAAGRPVYQEIARKALHPRHLRLSDRAIAMRLGATHRLDAHIGCRPA